MTIKISDFQNRAVQTGTQKTVSRDGDAAATAADSKVAGSSPVRITDQARQLAALEHAVTALPVVNESRVADIRLALEEGRYQVDAGRIADKLLRTEQELSAR